VAVVTIDATALMKVGIGARNDIPFVSPVDLRIRIAFNRTPRPILSLIATSGSPRERHASQ
jgi:hypothetical protein